MQRIRFFRIAIPILLLVFVVGTALVLTSHPPRREVAVDDSTDQTSRMEGFKFSDLAGGRRRLLVRARVGRVDEKGAFDVEQVQRLEVDREGQSPLALTAEHGTGSGAMGKRIVQLTGGVTLDDGQGSTIEIPSAEVDQVRGYVRSLGVVKLSQNAWKGTADSVIYDLNGGPTKVAALKLEGPNGGRLSADSGSMPAGSNALSLSGNVDAAQGGVSLHADEVMIARRADGHVESVTASPKVAGTATLGGGAASLSAQQAKIFWDEAGRLSGFHLEGAAKILHARGRLSADGIDGKSAETPGSYRIDAKGAVHVDAALPKGPGTLLCDALEATLDDKGSPRDGAASGHVRFDGDGAAGEAEQAQFTVLDASGTVSLASSSTRRARLASGRMRVVAYAITTDLRGVKLHADGSVESTLLPATGPKAAAGSAMFSGTEAVHFVSASLDSLDSGAHLLFHGEVRGWQQDRTLFADDVELIQTGEALNAHGHVATRTPREATRAASEADYVQVSADTLAYRGAERTAQYDGSVKVRQAEGWLESPRLNVLLAASGSGVREIRAESGVKFEYRSAGEGGTAPTTATGEGDRAVYDTATRIFRVYGDKGPAQVKSTGARAGTTVGRVLRYDLGPGAPEVESVEPGPAT